MSRAKVACLVLLGVVHEFFGKAASGAKAKGTQAYARNRLQPAFDSSAQP